MEEVLIQFDLISKEIFTKLKNKDLAKCREAERSWQNFIDQEKLSWIRIVVQKYSCQGSETHLHLAAKTGQIEMYKGMYFWTEWGQKSKRCRQKYSNAQSC